MVRFALLAALAAALMSTAPAQAQYYTTFYQSSNVYFPSSHTVTYYLPAVTYYAAPATVPISSTAYYAPSLTVTSSIPTTTYYSPVPTTQYYVPATNAIAYPVTYYATYPRWWWRWW